ncbi:MAG: hypothetical protein PHY73_04945 [Candidatus Omnitrophica bacterium]|nr:hypothetical protein [Candidatus Omnitrophota bacterium]
MIIKKLSIFLFFFTLLGCVSTKPFGVPDRNSRQEYVQANPEISDNIKKAILEERIVVGMTKEQVAATWGKPSSIDDSNDGSHLKVHGKEEESWWYRSFFGSTYFVDFNFGKVVYSSSQLR